MDVICLKNLVEIFKGDHSFEDAAKNNVSKNVVPTNYLFKK